MSDVKLYPPYLEGTIPAFYEEQGTAELVVPFSMNKAVSGNQVHGMGIKIKTVQSNSFIYDGFVQEDGSILIDDLSTGDYGKIEIDSSSSVNNKLTVKFTNQFYKYQDKTLTETSFNAYLNNYEVSETRLVDKNTKVEIQPGDTFDSTKEYQIKKRRFEVGMYYKVQIAYSSNNSSAGLGYWSTVAVVKFTTKPDVIIEGLKLGKVNLHRRTYIGSYSQAALSSNSEAIAYRDITEKEYSYRFILTDESGNILRDSGVQLHNNSTDLNNYESFDTYTVPLELNEGISYYLQYIITTNNNMTIESAKYRIMYAKSVQPEIHAKVITKLNYDNGYVNIRLEGEKTGDVESNITGSFLISRSDDKSNFTIWDEITRFNLVGQIPSSWNWKDLTVEHGVKYRYALQQYNENNLYSEKILSVYLDDNGNEINEPLEVYFEDSFLYDGDIQLKIKYNPKISSFKTNLMETKVDTIGSKYPFIFRNGAVEYKEFPISGLISYLSDEENLFVTDEDLDLTKNFTHWTRETTLSLPKDINAEDYFFDLEVYSDLSYDDIEIMRQGYERRKIEEKDIVEAKQRTTDLLDYNIAAERAFKLKVLDWLNNGKIKLFRSPAEGNYIVRLMNVSFSPEDRLGRMLHTFNCTAYEIDECTYDNLLSHNLLNSTLKTGRVYNEFSIPLFRTSQDSSFGLNPTLYEQYNEDFEVLKPGQNILPAYKEVVGLTFEDIPYSGMTYNVKFNGDNVLIKGNSPSYNPDLHLTFDNLEISQSLYDYLCSSSSQFVYEQTPTPQIHVSYYEVSDSVFDTVTDIILDTIPSRQWLGSSKHITQKYLNDSEINELRNNENINIIKIESIGGDNALNYHQLVTYQTDNFVDMFKNVKEDVLRFLYVHFYKREVSDENNVKASTYAWQLTGANKNILTHYENGVATELTMNLFEDNSTKHLDQDVMYKFIFKSNDRIKQIPSVLRGTGAFPVSEGQRLHGDVIFYYDITHPYTLYYDSQYFVDETNLYGATPIKRNLDPADIRLFEEFNNRPYKLKFEPYSLLFSFNNGSDVSLEFEVIKDRINPVPFVAKEMVIGNGVGVNFAIETQTLSYQVEENNEILHNSHQGRSINLEYEDWSEVKNCVTAQNFSLENMEDEEKIPPYYFYQKYYGDNQSDQEGCLEIIDDNYSIDLPYNDVSLNNSVMDAIDDAYAALSKLYIGWYLDSANKSYCIIHKLKDKAIIQLDRQLAAWKEEELY